MVDMYLGCICGGWLELLLTAGGFTFLLAIWNYIGSICKKLGCLCKCHNNNKKE